MQALGRGEPEALAELHRRFERRARVSAQRICGDPDTAEDVVQEVFLRVWRDPHGYDPARATVATWLMMLVHHRAVDAVRRETTRRARVDALEDVAPTTVEGADEEAMALIDAEGVRHALRELSPSHRQALVLAYYGGYSQSEIGRAVGVPLGTVKSRTFVAMRELRSALVSGLRGRTHANRSRELLLEGRDDARPGQSV